MEEEVFTPSHGRGKLKKRVKGAPPNKGAGRKLGSRSLKTIATEIVDICINRVNKVTNKKEDNTILHHLFMAQVNKGLKGDTASFNALMDRLAGKPKQETEITLPKKIIVKRKD